MFSATESVLNGDRNGLDRALAATSTRRLFVTGVDIFAMTGLKILFRGVVRFWLVS